MPQSDIDLIDEALTLHPSMWIHVNSLISKASSLTACRVLLRIRHRLCVLDKDFHR